MDKKTYGGQTRPTLPVSCQLPGIHSKTSLQNTEKHIQLKPNMENQTQTNAEVNANHNSIATSWFQERRRQAKTSFNVAICLWTATAVFGIGAGVSVFVGNVPAATANTALGLTSCAAQKRLSQLSDAANKRLDETAKELLDDE